MDIERVTLGRLSGQTRSVWPVLFFFPDPLFEALGWDVRNTAGAGLTEREVIRESGRTLGRVDYAFRVEGQPRFFVEAKALHVPLERSDVIMQAKSYAWNTRDVFVAAVTD